MPYKVLIVDDELPARKELRYILEEIKEIEIVKECANGKEALLFLQSNEIDLLFLDVEMPVMNGIECAKIIMYMPNAPKIVFSTGFDQFAVNAFELGAFDYILKPYSDERVQATIERFFDYAALTKTPKSNIISSKNKITLTTSERLLVFDPPTEIIMVKTECGSSLFYTTRGIIKTNLLLKDAEENLANSGFIRTHKSFIVNSNMIREIIPYFNDTFILVMQHYEKEEVPVSRHFMKSFKSIIGLK
ncbi:MAG: response regulator transcription factor [Acholeplasmataceae bacterium]|nr:response regulator transcription factor [Acholeplasmataceae bacterium]